MRAPEIRAQAFMNPLAASPANIAIPPGARAWRIEGFPDAAAVVPSTLCHYRVRLVQSTQSASPAGMPVGSDFLAEYDFLEHPELWGAWIPLDDDDGANHHALRIDNGGFAGVTGVIQKGRILFKMREGD